MVVNGSLEKEVDNFKKLFLRESSLLNSRSLKTINRRKWNKPKMIPLANGVKKLNMYLKLLLKIIEKRLFY